MIIIVMLLLCCICKSYQLKLSMWFTREMLLKQMQEKLK